MFCVFILIVSNRCILTGFLVPEWIPVPRFLTNQQTHIRAIYILSVLNVAFQAKITVYGAVTI